jgi:hypothetical protein
MQRPSSRGHSQGGMLHGEAVSALDPSTRRGIVVDGGNPPVKRVQRLGAEHDARYIHLLGRLDTPRNKLIQVNHAQTLENVVGEDGSRLFSVVRKTTVAGNEVVHGEVVVVYYFDAL